MAFFLSLELSLRSGALTVAQVQASVQRLWSEFAFANAARKLAYLFAKNDALSNFRAFIRNVQGAEATAAGR
jgi:hypothetical protein